METLRRHGKRATVERFFHIEGIDVVYSTNNNGAIYVHIMGNYIMGI